MSTPPASFKRLAYIDWMRGLACVLMIQAHCYDSWLTPEARKGGLYRWSQEISTMAAPIFLFLCGVSLALVTERLWQKKKPPKEIFHTALLRGGEIFGFGLLLRVQEFVLGYPKSPWTDLLKVDVLNILGISILLMAVFWRLMTWIVRQEPIATDATQFQIPVSDGAATWRNPAIVISLALAAVIAVATPPLWTTHRPRFLPWMLESYISGVHNYNTPEPWIFSIFPWCGFAFLGLAFGLFLFTDFAQKSEHRALFLTGTAGGLACGLSLWWDWSPVKFYAVYDYWRNSPNFFLMRCGILLLLALAIFAWCRWGPATKGFSPVIQMGKASLLVYWVHIEFVYGRLSILPKSRTGIPFATMGMVVILCAVVAIAHWRINAQRQVSRPLQPASAPGGAGTPVHVSFDRA
jgi:uncharacterized membrane protein